MTDDCLNIRLSDYFERRREPGPADTAEGDAPDAPDPEPEPEDGDGA